MKLNELKKSLLPKTCLFILPLHDFLGSKGFSQAKPSTKLFVLGSSIVSIRVRHRYQNWLPLFAGSLKIGVYSAVLSPSVVQIERKAFLSFWARSRGILEKGPDRAPGREMRDLSKERGTHTLRYDKIPGFPVKSFDLTLQHSQRK